MTKRKKNYQSNLVSEIRGLKHTRMPWTWRFLLLQRCKNRVHESGVDKPLLLQTKCHDFDTILANQSVTGERFFLFVFFSACEELGKFVKNKILLKAEWVFVHNDATELVAE